MAKIKRVEFPPALAGAYEQRNLLKETNDCTVIALSVVTGMDYMSAHKAMEDVGRQPGKGAWGIDKAISNAGFKRIRVDVQSIIAKLPKPHRDVLKNLTTHHPRRFPGCIDENKVYLAHTARHVLGIKGGVVQDWTINSSKRIYALYEIEKL